jgi:hypothetical protein
VWLTDGVASEQQIKVIAEQQNDSKEKVAESIDKV